MNVFSRETAADPGAPDAGMTAEIAGTTAGTAGTTAEIAGMTAGTAGMTAETAGMTAGTVGTTAETAGMTVGTGGTATIYGPGDKTLIFFLPTGILIPEVIP